MRIDSQNPGKGEKRHIHVEKGGEKYSQNEDGSNHKKGSGNPPNSVIKELKKKFNWDWVKKEESYQNSLNPLVLHIEGCNIEKGECECGTGYSIMWDTHGVGPIVDSPNIPITPPVPAPMSPPIFAGGY